MTYEQWFAENKKYIHGADVDAWCEAAFKAEYKAGRGEAQAITDPAEIRRVFELDDAEHPGPNSGFMKI